MATYKQLQEYIRQHYNYSAKTCWIAHVKSDHGLTRGVASNRYNADRREHPCPLEKRPHVEAALRHFGMI